MQIVQGERKDRGKNEMLAPSEGEQHVRFLGQKGANVSTIWGGYCRRLYKFWWTIGTGRSKRPLGQNQQESLGTKWEGGLTKS